MNHIEILQDVLNDFKKNTILSRYICNHIRFCTYHNSLTSSKYINYINEAERAIATIQSHRPSETLFPDIYNHETFIQQGRDVYWRDNYYTFINNWDRTVRLEKIKYLELLINKLKSEL